jgi:hypothetical protein
MAVAALVVAIIAILVSVASVIYTRRSAVAQVGLTAIEHDRRLEERRPRLTGKVERVGSGPKARLQVTLASDEPLAAMDVTIPRVQGVALQGVSFSLNIHGVYPVQPGERAYRAFAYDPYSGHAAALQPRDSVTWAVEVADEHAETLRLEATCRGAAGEQWHPVLIEAPVEPDIARTIY